MAIRTTVTDFDSTEARLQVTLDLSVDLETWALTYGLDPADTRALVQDALLHMTGNVKETVQLHLAGLANGTRLA